MTNLQKAYQNAAMSFVKCVVQGEPQYIMKKLEKYPILRDLKLSDDGQAVFFHTKQTSGCCVYRHLLVEHYRKRVGRIEKEGYSRKIGYEPGCHHLPDGIDNHIAKEWMSPIPNVDVRHGNNLTSSRFKETEYRSRRSIIGWTLADEIPGWGVTKNRFNDFLKGVLK